MAPSLSTNELSIDDSTPPVTLASGASERSIRVHDRSFRPHISREEIQATVARIATKINRDFVGQELTVLIILRGGMVFGADLIRLLNVPCKIETLRAASYNTGMMSQGVIDVEDVFPDLSNRNVLIVEDIIDTGTTIVELIKQIGLLQPASVTVSALLSKPSMHKERLLIDYVGLEIGADFVVGYGMDYAGYGRELDSIWIVEDDVA
ncbi:MAG: hypoxanthine phosphoribosyltransferase [bacterium]|nr:hypoxanthine phosphoribosyltransferase [bacterium]